MKRLLILCCALATLASPAWGGGLLIGSGVTSSGTCDVNASYNQTNMSGGADSQPTRYQKLKVVSSVTVCSVDLSFLVIAGTHSIRLQFKTNDGSQNIGSASDTLSVSSSGIKTFTFETKPTLTSDCRMYIILDAESTNLRVNLSADYSYYEDTTYDYISNGSDRNKDAYFVIRTLQ